jgi:hypothetical protein
MSFYRQLTLLLPVRCVCCCCCRACGHTHKVPAIHSSAGNALLQLQLLQLLLLQLLPCALCLPLLLLLLPPSYVTSTQHFCWEHA